MKAEPSDEEYGALLDFRTGLRRFERWSAKRARQVGLTPSQHQLLLVVRGSRDDGGPMIARVAEHLLLRHHSAVELVDRAAEAGLVERERDEADQRVVRLRLTDEGHRRLASLSIQHRDELTRLRPRFEPIWAGLEDPKPST